MRRRVLGVAAAVASVAMLATACGGGGDDTQQGATEEAGGTITVWARDSQQGFMSQLVNQYNKNHKVQAKVTIIPGASFVQKLGTAASSGAGPDVSSIDLVFAPYFARAEPNSRLDADAIGKAAGAKATTTPDARASRRMPSKSTLA